MTFDYVVGYIPLYKAALEDDWEKAEEIFKDDPEAITAQITYYWETPLHIAVGTNRCHRFVEKLIKRITTAEGLLTTTYGGNNALHYAAKVGNTRAAKLLVEKLPQLTQISNPYRKTPLKLAAWHGQKEMLWYLLTVTKDVIEEDGTSPYRGLDGADLFTLSITADFYDVALYLVKNYRHLVTDRDRLSQTALQTLAAKPQAFRSGSSLWFWQDFIYSCIPMQPENAFSNPIEGVQKDYVKMWRESKGKGTRAHSLFKIGFCQLNEVFWSVIKRLAPFIQHLYEMKLMHMQTLQLVKVMCSEVIEKGEHAVVWNVLGETISTATKFGIHELVEECIRVYPGVIWYKDEGRHFIHTAIKYRQEKVFNLIYQISNHQVYTTVDAPNNDNSLHSVGRLPPPHRRQTVPGAALQMQQELQWFQEVEQFIHPSYREAKNSEGQTPKMLFTKEHEDLVKQGERWMKDTATSCTVVAALIITVAFAAAFTVPGGNTSDGLPLLVRDRLFMLFIVSDALALFSSSTSVLMFLAILTSRYAEHDFLHDLPQRLTIGLLSLFLSITTTMIAFSATLALMLSNETKWIAFPVALLAGLPVTFFVRLQFPLLVEIVKRNLFHQTNILLH